MSSMIDFIIENGVLMEYVGPGGDVVIPDGVTEIGQGAFSANEALTGVVFPEKLALIGRQAFLDCVNLKEVHLSGTVKTICQSAFHGCSSLEILELPSYVDLIEDYAFSGCKALSDSQGFVIVQGILFDYFGEGGDVVVPEGVEVIASSSLKRCDRIQREHVDLTSIVFPQSLTRIGDSMQ